MELIIDYAIHVLTCCLLCEIMHKFLHRRFHE
jgi:hypothetical protein